MHSAWYWSLVFIAASLVLWVVAMQVVNFVTLWVLRLNELRQDHCRCKCNEKGK